MGKGVIPITVCANDDPQFGRTQNAFFARNYPEIKNLDYPPSVTQKSLCAAVCLSLLACLPALAAGVTAITDNTSYNAGSVVRIRLQPAANITASIRYAGEEKPVAAGILLYGSDYVDLWTIPWDARTGRYEVDLAPTSGPAIRAATSFAVHRQFAKITTVELDKTFYNSGDTVNPYIVVRNLSNRTLDHLQLEFEPYTYPWIAPAPDEPPMWKTVITDSLTLGPGQHKEFRVEKAAVVQAEKEPVSIYYSVVIRDHLHPDRIYDLAFAPPAFTTPPNTPLPKQYPFLYLYQHLRDVPKSEAYRHFYPPPFVSDLIKFDTSHTMFPTGVPTNITYTVAPPPGATSIQTRVLDADGKQLAGRTPTGPLPGPHTETLASMPPGRYTFEVALLNTGVTVAQNRIEFAVNRLPKSILVFAAHEDDDTAHPGIIRAAVESNIPIHFVYFTSGDAGGCDRFYMHSCDAARAMDFGEVRMEEARTSLGHLGVPRDNIFFLGLPDGGMEQIWYDHLKPADPYLSVLLASDHAPYRDVANPNLPYARESVVAAAKDFIARYRPELIITGHPDERHVDHRTNNWIVVEAMQELLRDGRSSRDTQLIVDVAYGAAPGRRAPYHYEKSILNVSGEAARLGQEALWYYQSQDGNHQQANIVGYDKLPREEPYPHFRILDWQDHAGWNEKR